jgi:transposase
MVEPSKIHTSESSDQVILSRNEYEALIGLNHKLQSDNLYLHHELEKLKRMIFGAKSERFVASDTSQLSLELGQSAPSPVEPPT